MANSKFTTWSSALVSGQRFGRWVLIAPLPHAGRTSKWICRCDCGAQRSVEVRNIFYGRSLSCGCAVREQLAAWSTKHGLSRSVEYTAWTRIVDRCTNPNNHKFSDYGGRGISVADEWRHNPLAFVQHIGPRPSPRHSVDRIDNNRGYEPGNVRWATAFEQAHNRRPSRIAPPPFPPSVGEKNGRAILNEMAVVVIKFLLRRGVSTKRLAATHGVSTETIRHIRRGLKWAHVELP